VLEQLGAGAGEPVEIGDEEKEAAVGGVQRHALGNVRPFPPPVDEHRGRFLAFEH